MFDGLEAADGAAELDARLGVVDRQLEPALGAADLFGGQRNARTIANARQHVGALGKKDPNSAVAEVVQVLVWQALMLENFDFNEFQAVLDDLTMALDTHLDQLKTWGIALQRPEA